VGMVLPIKKQYKEINPIHPPFLGFKQNTSVAIKQSTDPDGSFF
jgi:hypothetical protein